MTGAPATRTSFRLWRVLAVCALLSGLPNYVNAGAAFPNLEALKRVASWKLTFFYRLDDPKDDGNAVSGEGVEGWSSRLIEVSGRAVFTRSGDGAFVGRTGRAAFDYHTASEARGTPFEGDARQTGVAFREDGRGEALIDDTSTLDFDFEAWTYGFTVYLGGEDGVEVTSESSFDPGMKESIDRYGQLSTGEDELSEKTKQDTHRVVKEIQKVIPFKEQGAAMETLGDVGAWFRRDEPADDRADISVQVDWYPLPFFGQTLGGTTTDYEGALVAWKLEPAEGLAATGDTLPSEAWVHYHPLDAETRREVVSMGETLATARASSQTSKKKLQFRVPLTPPDDRVYLLDPAPRRAKAKAVCGEALVVVEADAGPLEQRWPRTPAATGAGWDPAYSPPDPSWETPDDSPAVTDRLRHLFSTVTFPDQGKTLFNPLEVYVNLTLVGVQVRGGEATVYLEGPFSERRSCDRNRVIAQITETCLLAASVQRVTILRNGEPF